MIVCVALTRFASPYFDSNGHARLVGVSYTDTDENLRVILSKRLEKFFPQPALEQNFVPYAGKPIRLPEKLAEPDEGFLQYHREIIYQI